MVRRQINFDQIEVFRLCECNHHEHSAIGCCLVKACECKNYIPIQPQIWGIDILEEETFTELENSITPS